MDEQKKVLCVGLVCLDIINVVDKYPEEDSDSRLAHKLMLIFTAAQHAHRELRISCLVVSICSAILGGAPH